MSKQVDRQMIVPKDYDKSEFPVVGANPKRSQLNPNERRNFENKAADAPKNPFGTSRQSRY
jgi:hypothetical protein